MNGQNGQEGSLANVEMDPLVMGWPPQAGPASRPGSQEGLSSRVVLATYSLDFGVVIAGSQKVGLLPILFKSLQVSCGVMPLLHNDSALRQCHLHVRIDAFL
jgi:hypothetical protein